MVSSLDSIRLPSKSLSYPAASIAQKNQATIEAWAEMFISAVEQMDQIQPKNKEFPSYGMMNLVECEIPDLKYLWSDYLYSNKNSVILHAIALLDKKELWTSSKERETMVQVIASSSVETLLRPASAIPLKTSIHSISALAAVQKEFTKIEKELLFELICTAHRSILTKANESHKIGIKGIQLIHTAVSNYINNEHKQLEHFKNGTVLKERGYHRIYSLVTGL